MLHLQSYSILEYLGLYGSLGPCHGAIEDPDPIEVKGGYQSDNPPIPTQVNMMRVICHPDKMDVVRPQVAECVAGYAAYAQSLPTTKFDGTYDFDFSSVLEMALRVIIEYYFDLHPQ